MAMEAPAGPERHKKLPRLPDNQKIQKRPLLHAPITAPRRGASAPKAVYVSASSPFIATVKRVQALLSHVEDRASGLLSIAGGDKKLFRDIEAGIKGNGKGSAEKNDGKNARDEEVVMKATGKAIEKLLRLAIWWQGQDGVIVRIRTGSVGAIDDVVGKGEEGEIVEESRIRRTSCLEVGVRLG